MCQLGRLKTPSGCPHLLDEPIICNLTVTFAGVKHVCTCLDTWLLKLSGTVLWHKLEIPVLQSIIFTLTNIQNDFSCKINNATTSKGNLLICYSDTVIRWYGLSWKVILSGQLKLWEKWTVKWIVDSLVPMTSKPQRILLLTMWKLV